MKYLPRNFYIAVLSFVASNTLTGVLFISTFISGAGKAARNPHSQDQQQDADIEPGAPEPQIKVPSAEENGKQGPEQGKQQQGQKPCV